MASATAAFWMTYLNFHPREGLAEGEHAKLEAEEEEEKVSYTRWSKHRLMLLSKPFANTQHPRSHLAQTVGSWVPRGSSLTSRAGTLCWTSQSSVTPCNTTYVSVSRSHRSADEPPNPTSPGRRRLSGQSPWKELPQVAHCKGPNVCRVTLGWNITFLRSFPVYTKPSQWVLAFLKSRNFITVISVTNECFPCGEVVWEVSNSVAKLD